MSEESKRITQRPVPLSRIMVNEQTAKVYEDALETKKRGERIAWSTAIYVQEICETLGVPVLYPENHSAALAAKHYGEDLIQYAEGNMRYPMNICSYARINFAFADKLKDPNYEWPSPAMPLPDLLLLANNSCVQLTKWYQNLSDTLGVPAFFIDMLYNFTEEKASAYKVKYIRTQIEEAITALEAFIGRKFDWDKFSEIQKRSALNNKLFKEIIALNVHKPAPLNGFDLFNYMAPMVICRGKESTTDILLQLKKEVEENIKNNTSTYPVDQEHRVFWEGIACWPCMRHNLKTLRNLGINAVTNGYVTAWDINYEPTNLDGMAAAYNFASTNSKSTPTVARLRSDLIKKFGCKGMICHVNKSCKVMDFHVFGGRDLIQKYTGVPIVNFDGDQGDSRSYSEAQFETRIQGLAEIMKQNKEGNHA